MISGEFPLHSNFFNLRKTHPPPTLFDWHVISCKCNANTERRASTECQTEQIQQINTNKEGRLLRRVTPTRLLTFMMDEWKVQLQKLKTFYPQGFDFKLKKMELYSFSLSLQSFPQLVFFCHMLHVTAHRMTQVCLCVCAYHTPHTN